ncbi:MAG: ATP-binding cassette domain-containing protein, partial [Candidatus Neomarinimicrobiota bacterium]
MVDIPCITTISISKSFGSRPLFTDISFSVSPDEKMGLIGPNGSGKSTLLKILAGTEYPDSGEVARKRGTRLIYLSQEDVFDPGRTVGELLLADLPGDLQDWERSKRLDEIRNLVGFADLNQSVATLSGGWRKRLAIGQALLRNPDVLLMDEPTNHLDLEGILWLEKLLQSASFAFLLVSHDRYFLENVTNRIVELDKRYANGYLKVEGNYSSFIERRARFIAQQTRQELTLSNTVRREIEWLRRGPKARTTKARSRIDSANQLIDDLAEVQYRNTLKRSARIDFEATERKTKILLAGKKLSKSRSG